MVLSFLTIFALAAASAVASIPPSAISQVHVATGPGKDFQLSWTVNISYYSVPEKERLYEVNTSHALLWPGNQTLDNLMYDIWVDLGPPHQPPDVLPYFLVWDNLPLNVSRGWHISDGGSCVDVLGAACVKAVGDAPYGDPSKVFGAPECANTLGVSNNTFFRSSIITPQNSSEKTLSPVGFAPLGSSNEGPFDSSNLTALYQAESRLQMLLLQGAPWPIIACQVVNASGTEAVRTPTPTAKPNAAIPMLAAHTSARVAFVIAAMLALI